MALPDRIGVDIGRRLRIEDAVHWAAARDVRYIDIQLDTAANALTSLDDARTSGIRRSCESQGVHLGLIPPRRSMSPNIHPISPRRPTNI